MLVDLSRLGREYIDGLPDLDDPERRVSLGTSGHRGSFTETPILAITLSSGVQELVRRQQLFGEFIIQATQLDADVLTHSLSDPSVLVPLYSLKAQLGLFASISTRWFWG
jgi:hypothetical protein